MWLSGNRTKIPVLCDEMVSVQQKSATPFASMAVCYDCKTDNKRQAASSCSPGYRHFSGNTCSGNAKEYSEILFQVIWILFQEHGFI